MSDDDALPEVTVPSGQSIEVNDVFVEMAAKGNAILTIEGEVTITSEGDADAE